MSGEALNLVGWLAFAVLVAVAGWIAAYRNGNLAARLEAERDKAVWALADERSALHSLATRQGEAMTALRSARQIVRSMRDRADTEDET